MNIIINGFQTKESFLILQRIFSSVKIDSFIFTFDDFKPNFGRLNTKGTLINWRKINFHGDYGVNWNKLEPIDEELIVQMRSCEAIVIKMMDRLETYKNYSYQERKELYFSHLRFWNDKIIKNKIDLFLSQNVPHETSDFVCYTLCKLKKIPTILLSQTHIPDTCLIFQDWENTDYGLKKEYDKLTTKLQNTKINEIKLSPKFEKYYNLQTNKQKSNVPFYMQKKSFIKEALKKIAAIYLKIIKNPTVYFHEGKVITVVLIRRFFASFKTYRLMNYYEKNCKKFNPKDKYIFVALHFQPEMTTSPRSDAYVDQILMIQLLSACVPKSVKVLVKEHPLQKALGRTKKFYSDILSLPNIAFVSRKVGAKDLVDNCLAVATGVGTVGFESFFKNKPVLMFGHDFYEYAPGSFPVRTKTDLENAINKIIKHPILKPKPFKIFLKTLDNVSINGTIDTNYLPTSTLTLSQNSINISEAIIKTIKRIKV